MLEKKITYVDFNGVERTDVCRFHLSPAEMVELQMSIPGGFQTELQRVVDEKDGPAIMEIFKTLLHKSYGVKSADGKRFDKSEELWNEFANSNAYVELFMQLVTDESAAQAFADGVLPSMDKYIRTA